MIHSLGGARVGLAAAVSLVVAAATCAFTASPHATAQGSVDGRAAQVDDVFAEFTKPGSPGCAVAVSERGQIIFAKGYGTANLANDVPIDLSTMFNLASISKMFTGAPLPFWLFADSSRSTTRCGVTFRSCRIRARGSRFDISSITRADCAITSISWKRLAGPGTVC